MCMVQGSAFSGNRCGVHGCRVLLNLLQGPGAQHYGPDGSVYYGGPYEHYGGYLASAPVPIVQVRSSLTSLPLPIALHACN